VADVDREAPPVNDVDRGGRLQAAQDLRWVRVTACDNIPPREGRAVSIADREIAIFNLGDRFVAVDNRCPHKGGPLADGIVTGTSVVCPLHTWKISLVDGHVERPAAADDEGVTAYPARIEAGVVVVGVPVDAAGADKPAMKLQNCLATEPLLHERRPDPPCPNAEGCVSSISMIPTRVSSVS
jgi:nitrite reductase (NADH) small subunit